MGRSESSAPSIRPICSGTAVVKSWGNLAVKSCLLTCVALSTALWGQAPDSNQSGATPDPPATTASPVQPNQTTRDARSDDTYIIGDDDVLAVSVWNEANISKEIPVRSDGKISLPLVGEVLAAGRTPPQLEQEIATRLRGFITDPQVTVIVEQMNSQKFNIFGQVGRPGSYKLIAGVTIVDALASAGGLKDFAKKKSIYVLRQNPGGGEMKIPFNYDKFIKGKDVDQNIQIKQNDTIVVP
jgi:polysaccharide export outer membrane protein